MRSLILLVFSFFLSCVAWAAAPAHPADWVNLRIGTAGSGGPLPSSEVAAKNSKPHSGHGHVTYSFGQTFPATGMPFGMTQWTPQTRSGENKCIAPYYDEDMQIQGFRGSHFLSGSCTQDYGSLTLMPLSGALTLGAAQRASAYSRSTEVMKPYDYAVTLDRYKVRVEMTGTARAGMFRFHFEGKGRKWILVQSNARSGEGIIHIDPSKNEITAVNPAHRIYAGWGESAGIAGNFVVIFNHPFHVGGTWSGDTRHDGSLDEHGGGGAPGAYVYFDLKPGETLEARVGTSFTSVNEARLNLEAEIPGWNFDQVVQRSEAAWNTALGKIQIKGSASQRHIFYTALYHSLLLPRIYSDADGTYPAFASGRPEKGTGTYYGDYSIWDIFRAQQPLLTILDPERAGAMVRSLILKGEAGGYLPIFPAWNSYTAEMIGDHADALIADAYFKGIGGFDIRRAYELMRKNATTVPPPDLHKDGRGRRGLQAYLTYGYIPLEVHLLDSPHRNQQVSRTLEYAYDDFLVGKVAGALGKAQDAEMFARRSGNYRNVIDPQTGFARGRYRNGSWVTPFDPGKRATYITEGLPYQYTFFVPQDIPGLIQVLGGKQVFIHKLDVLFEDGYYDQGNEPSEQIAYFYDFAGAAWKTQQHVHQILETNYFDRPDGLPGNDDCGQVSAWYVLSSLGFYPVTPGVPRYSIGTPEFEDATILLPGGQKFEIRAPGASHGKTYIQSATLNGRLLTSPWIDHSQIMAGGTLVFHMSRLPDRDWGRSAR